MNGSPATADQRFMQEGSGWRLGWDTTAPHYRGLLAGDTWAIELTETEFFVFRRLVVEIDATIEAIAAELADSERVTCEAEADGLWLEIDGFPHAYSLRFILLSNRRCEGEWDAVAAQELVQAVHHLALF
ncbi:MAG: DUF1818 family protein [Nodosilinea sp.]